MKKFFSFFFGFVAIVSLVAAVAYWVYHFLSAANRCPRIMFQSNFTDDDAPSPDTAEVKEACTSCDAGDAVCAVDMCMPY